ncbi:MAG: zf-HC2 domain-containing protein [Deltaproteobacteria bacterium]|jgi:hypothetical protein|nr:MAG: zf-HC2 domain-containing protein [Deltaproteobacteria bacterium]
MVRKRNRKGVMMLSCRDVTQLISRSMDTSLPLGKRIGVRIHLLMCKFCERYEKQLLLIRETLRMVVDAEEPPEGASVEVLSEEARERIRKALRNP